MSINTNREVIKQLLDKDGIGYHTLKLNMFRFTDEGGPSHMRTCEVFCLAEEDLIQVYAYCPFKGKEERRDKILEFVTRANYDLRVGNFEYDVRDGELRYKATLYTGEEETVTIDQLKDVISAAVSTLHTYVDGFVRLSFDPEATVKECLDACENRLRGKSPDAEDGEGSRIDFGSMDDEQRERSAQLLCEALLERVGMKEEGAPEEETGEEDEA